MHRAALPLLTLALLLSVSGGIGLLRESPSSDESVAAVVPNTDPSRQQQISSTDLASSISALQQRLRDQPEDAQAWASLALAYVEQARRTGDGSYYPKAGMAVTRSLRVEPRDNALAHAARGALAAAQHRFSDALHESDRALVIDGYQPVALAIRVDALTELGRYGAQMRALRTADRRQPGVPVFARYSYALELRGRLGQAAALLRQALSSARDPGDRAFLLTQLAELDRKQGRLAAAGLHLDQALAADPAWVPAVAGRARLAVADGALRQAVRHWRTVIESAPLPEYVVELGELYAALGEPDLAREQYSVARATARLLESNGVRVDLDITLFLADHGSPAAALLAATAEWADRRSVHAADALGWALHANGRSGDALRLVRAATRLGTPDARLWIHRGLVELAVGQNRAGAMHLQRGLGADPGVSPWLANQARAALHQLAARR